MREGGAELWVGDEEGEGLPAGGEERGGGCFGIEEGDEEACVPVSEMDEGKVGGRDVRGELLTVFFEPGVEDVGELLISGGRR